MFEGPRHLRDARAVADDDDPTYEVARDSQALEYPSDHFAFDGERNEQTASVTVEQQTVGGRCGARLRGEDEADEPQGDRTREAA